jgi:hypothetical protein
MPKKIQFLTLAIVGLLLLSGCAKKADQGNAPVENKVASNIQEESATPAETVAETSSLSSKSALNTCPKENVSLSNYGDPGHRLENCFVEFPGEPSRQDKSYYIVEDICGQFTQSFMKNMLGEKITKIEPSQIATLNNCTYFLDDKENILLNLEYLSIENQKKGSEALGRKAEKSDQIPMENLVVWQDDNLINTIYLVLSPNKFLSLQPSSKNTIDKDKFLELAANIASAIKEYK